MKVVASKDCGFMKSLACLLSTFLLIPSTFAFCLGIVNAAWPPQRLVEVGEAPKNYL